MPLSISDSDIKIYNAALAFLGIPEVSSFLEESATANTGNKVYADVIEELISTYPWRFAMQKENLARVAETPPEPWEGFYQLPSKAKMVRNVFIDEYPAPFDVYGRLVSVRVQATSPSVVSAAFTVIPPVSQWPGYFRQAAILQLAARVAMPLTMDFDMAQQYDQRAQFQLMKAKTADAQGRTPGRINTKTFIQARRNRG